MFNPDCKGVVEKFSPICEFPMLEPPIESVYQLMLPETPEIELLKFEILKELLVEIKFLILNPKV